ncbi:TonB-dependent receptor [Phocaeicola sartorii]|uniref:TonB-dependent receptor n=1 Tax=Phocaeicola sartorii TaxID=671267 RepID=UPI00242D3842|nr:TonB-dependent receptor [Phocaeicola sartorii]
MMQFHSKISLLLLLCLMHFCIEAKGTEHEDEPLVTLDMRQAPVQKVLTEITRQTGVTFSYESSLIKHLPAVDITMTDKPLSYCLRILFQKLPVEYIQTGKYIILKKKQKTVVISGFVRDKASSESLIGASIYDAESHRGTTSNADGFFSLTLKAGNNVCLNISYVGYDSFQQSFTQLEQDTLLPILLSSHQQLAEVIITSQYTASSSVHTSGMGHTRLNKNLIRQTPVLFGESDIIKTLQTLPGVSAGMAGLAGMHVRGGNGDDNLYMIEGNPLYQINHVGGLFSAFNAEAVKDVEFFKSAFPARYGGRLSSVVDIHTKDGNMKEYHGSAMLGLTSGSLNLEGPVVKDRTSFNFALRRSWIDALSAPAIAIWNSTRDKGDTEIVARYAFTDMNFKLNHQFNDRSRGYVGVYWGNDFLKGGEKRDGNNGYESRNTGKLRWGNIMAFTGWSYVFSNRLFGNVNAAFTHYSSTLKGDYYQGTETSYVSQESSTRNRINDFSLRASFDFRPSTSHQLRFGAHYIYHRFHPVDEKFHFANGLTAQTRQSDNTILPAHELGIYMEEDWKINQKIRLNAGIHIGLYTIDCKTYTSLEPRLASRLLISPQLSLKASYTRMSQYVHQLNESYINLPTDTWMPVSRKLKPMQSDQIALGAYYTTYNQTYSFSIEGYYKWMKHLIDYKDNYQFLPPSTHWEDKLTQGKGRSYGIELIARKEKGKITGWAGYTLSWNDRQFTEINKGRRFPAKFDNRHKFNIVVNWKVRSKVELTGSWTYMTGNRITVSFENYQVISPQYTGHYLPMPGNSLTPPYMSSNGLDYYTERNNFQLPAYHRLDLGINIYRPKKKERMGIWNISIYNVYSYMAPVSIRKGWWYGENCFHTLGVIPIIPSVSYTYKF